MRYFERYTQKFMFHMVSRCMHDLTSFELPQLHFRFQMFACLIVEYINRHYVITFDGCRVVVPRVHHKRFRRRWKRTTRRQKINILADAIRNLETQECVYCGRVSMDTMCMTCFQGTSFMQLNHERNNCYICMSPISDPMLYTCMKHAGCIECVLE